MVKHDPSADRLLEHEYDGIREYDNRLPNWWLYTLYGSIIFSVGYWIVFHTLKVVPLPVGRYDMEMVAAAEAQLKKMEGQEITDETLALMTEIPSKVEAGKEIFASFCVVCHGTQGEGSVGPNLTDNYWIHGAQPTDILHTVMEGVPEKGMAAWSGQLGPRRVQEVVSYVLTIKNTNIPGKEPEGDPVGEGGDDAVNEPPADQGSLVPLHEEDGESSASAPPDKKDSGSGA